MKRILIIFIALGLSINTNAQCVGKGSILIDGYYGFPNFFGFIFKTAYNRAYPNGINVSSSSLGPVGGKAEYMLTDNLGLGLDFNYSNASITFSKIDTTAFINGSVVTQTHHYTLTTPAMRVMFGANWHFVRTNKVDVYAAVKVGYYNRNLSITTDDPNSSISSISINLNDPFAFRVEMGMRYFFTENFGAHAMIGVSGGPLVAVGISGKFGTAK